MSDNTATVLDTTADSTAATPKVKGKPGRPVQVNSVLAQCKTLFVQLAQAGKNRREILDAFVANANPPITRGTAQVYYHEAKNAAAEAGQNFDVKRSPSKPRAVKVTESTDSTPTVV